MRYGFWILIASAVGAASAAHAQRRPAEHRPPASTGDQELVSEDELDSESEEDEALDDEEGPSLDSDEPFEPHLQPPDIEPVDISSLPSAAPAAESTPVPASAEETANLLDRAAPPSSDPTVGAWSAPMPVLTLHGYFRVRGELQDTFFLGRPLPPGATTDLPFSRFRPLEDGVVPAGGCGGDGTTDPADMSACDQESLSFANMRLRLRPTLALSDDVRIHTMIDVFDNMVLGSTPQSVAFVPTPAGLERSPTTPGVTADTFVWTLDPPTAGRNSLSDSIVARRAWAEVTNRALGQLRFGRMGSHWGLGMLENAGDGIDSDFQSDVDRVMAITKIAGLYFFAAYDFLSEGFIQQNVADLSALAFDPIQQDDVDRFVFAVARRMDEEEQRAALRRGDWVLNGGLYLEYRNQLLSTQGIVPAVPDADDVATALVRRDAQTWTPDLWAQFLWGSLRVELEAALIAGSIENTAVDAFEPQDLSILQLGLAVQSEYRLLEDRLGLSFDTGFATGDADVDGLTVPFGFPAQEGGDDRVSTFRFHPNYRIDLILWRNIMGRIAGAYYFRPGVSYDILRNPFGQLLGAQFHLIYSRASSPVQTYGSDPNLGVELNLSLYYRSEDGPDLLDGFYVLGQYGILFPMGGLGFVSDAGIDEFPGGNPDLSNAQTLRLILGVAF